MIKITELLVITKYVYTYMEWRHQEQFYRVVNWNADDGKQQGEIIELKGDDIFLEVF